MTSPAVTFGGFAFQPSISTADGPRDSEEVTEMTRREGESGTSTSEDKVVPGDERGSDVRTVPVTITSSPSPSEAIRRISMTALDYVTELGLCDDDDERDEDEEDDVDAQVGYGMA